jgi:octopine/nopaline transport system ATP-binding protein
MATTCRALCYRPSPREGDIQAEPHFRAAPGAAATPTEPATAAEAIRAEDIHKSFGALEVLKGVSLRARKGDVVSIIGSSGSGKSTFLRCINLLEVPDRGSIAINGEEIRFGGRGRGGIDGRQVQRVRTRLSMVFQSFNLWPHRTVLGNVIEAPVHVKGVPRREAVERAEALLARIGLAEKRDEYPSRLSGGQQQRVAIVRALAMEPKVMLFDEVTSALDPELVGEVLDLMAALAADGMTLLLVTHEIAFARGVSSRTIFIDRGLIAEQGPSAEVLTRPANERTRQFLRRVLHARDGAPPP